MENVLTFNIIIKDRPEQTNTTAKKTKHKRRFKRTLIHIINLSKYELTHGETSLLSKGLNFIPTPKRNTQLNSYRTYYYLDRRLRLQYFFPPRLSYNHRIN